MRIPTSTYRLQFDAKMNLSRAAELTDYLSRLGVSDIYASPLLASGDNALNPYEVTDPSKLNPNVGDEVQFAKLHEQLERRQMGLLLDIVPNHMAISYASNEWWNDVLENGPSSYFADYFDIDWSPPRKELVGKVLLPILGSRFGEAIESQCLTLLYRDGVFAFDYYGRVLPTDPCSWSLILQPVAERAEQLFSDDDVSLIELQSIISALSHLPSTTEADGNKKKERMREKEVIKHRLGKLTKSCPDIEELLEDRVGKINGKPGVVESFDELERLLNLQPYRLSFWRVANHEINYRRFFDINDLAGLRVERFEVFKAVHDYLLTLVRRGWVTGLRIDHIDGLYDPKEYLVDLQRAASVALSDDVTEVGDKAIYMVVEKILCGNEQLRSSWPVHGTTGYEYLNSLGGLFVRTRNRGGFRKLYGPIFAEKQDVHAITVKAKQFVLDVAMASELHVLARQLDRISESSRYFRDFTLDNLHQALADVIACFPVYRSYIVNEVDADDDKLVTTAVKQAKKLNPALSNLLFDFVGQVLNLEPSHPKFVGRFQQLTGPVMAKGVEDTAFYRYYPLTSLNEVGSELGHFGTTVEQFHRENINRQIRWPYSMSATSTHDTKRSEDVRARLAVLSEMPEEWEKLFYRLQLLARPYKVELDADLIPSANEEYLLYQTLVGSWPLSGEIDSSYVTRIQQYMMKATKEAKVSTSWINPDNKFDNALARFIQAVLDDKKFTDEVRRFVEKITKAGLYNSLSQTVLKIASPGVPDFYQGSELWQFFLVDPDNRQPVDFELPIALLAGMEGRAPMEMLAELNQTLEDGRTKLYVTSRALAARQNNPELYLDGSYVPLKTSGDHGERIVAFARLFGDKCALVVAGRFFVEGRMWPNTYIELPEKLHGVVFKDRFSGVEQATTRLEVDQLLAHLPVALLEGTLL